MLVLSRKLGENIVIGDRVVVTVVKLDNGQVHLGIEAPQEIGVFREEITPRASPWCNRSSERYPDRRSMTVRQGSGRGTGGNRGVPSVREGHGTDAVGSAPGHCGRRINRILSRILPPAYRYCTAPGRQMPVLSLDLSAWVPFLLLREALGILKQGCFDLRSCYALRIGCGSDSTRRSISVQCTMARAYSALRAASSDDFSGLWGRRRPELS